MATADTSTAPPKPPPVDATNGELVRWAFDVINTHDVEPLKPMWVDAVEYFPGLTAHGPEEIAAYFNASFAAMPDFRLEIMGLAEDGENVLVRWRASGHFTGEHYQGIAPTGSAMQINGCDHFVIRDGRVVTNHVVIDQLDFARQIGMMPPDGSIADRALKTAFNAKTLALSKLRRGEGS